MRILIVAFALLYPSLAHAGFEEAARYNADNRGISMLVMVDGEIVFEDYPNGGSSHQANNLASGTKSFSGIIAAALVQDGLLDLDERVSDTIHRWRGNRRGDDRENITVRQLLSLTDGLDHRGRMARPPTYARAITSQPEHRPGTVFTYHPAPFQIFGELVQRKLNGESPLAYLERRIFDPIGLEYGDWKHGRDGNPHLPSGASITARNWATFGQFILQNGAWEGEQLVDRHAFAELFMGSSVNPAYGITWWLNEPVDATYARRTSPMAQATDFWQDPDAFPDNLVLAAGAGNQRLYISWEENLVVVRQADGVLRGLLSRRNDWSDVEFFRLLMDN